jgi:hypothetical protein
MYQLTNNAKIIVRTADGACIPADTLNIDYQNYLSWIAAGNAAIPYVAPVIDPRSIMVLTPAKFRRNLIKLGYYNAALTAISKLSATNDIALNFQYSTSFERLNPELLAIAAQFNLTDSQIDAIFTA